MNISPYEVFNLFFLQDLHITSLSKLFNLILNLKKMQKRYFTFCLINAALVMAIVLSSCSEKDEDIAAPSITIIQPVENDTIQLLNGFVTIDVVARDHVSISDMEMSIKDKSGTILYTYDVDDLEDQSYTCHEKFYPTGITKVTKMILSVTFSNEFENWTSKAITFYVKP